MKTFRDSASIRNAPLAVPAVAQSINKLLAVLADYPEYELDKLVNIIVVDAGDSLEAVTDALGFALEDQAVEHIDAHLGWFELTYIVSGDGFGLVVYVPDRADIAPQVLQFCREQAATGQL